MFSGDCVLAESKTIFLNRIFDRSIEWVILIAYMKIIYAQSSYNYPDRNNLPSDKRERFRQNNPVRFLHNPL